MERQRIVQTYVRASGVSPSEFETVDSRSFVRNGVGSYGDHGWNFVWKRKPPFCLI
jgi:hypothetical protein